jgi:hypothetical protein
VAGRRRPGSRQEPEGDTVTAPDGHLASELGDVLQLLEALAAARGMSCEDVMSEASRERAERRGFDNRIHLEYVDKAL